MSQPLGFQKVKEIYEKPEYNDIVANFKYTRDKGTFEYGEYNIYGLGSEQQLRHITPMKKADALAIAETVKALPFVKIAKEFLAQSGSTGIGGAAYLVPTKIYQILQTYASPRDIINDVSMAVIPAEEIPGSTLDIDIAVGGSYAPHVTTSGGEAPEEEIGFTKATLSFVKTLTVNFNIANDLVEDTPQLNLIETHVRMAGAEMGKRSTTEVLSVMSSTSDGDGTLNTETAGADTTTLEDVSNAQDQVLVDEFMPDRVLAQYHVMKDAVMKDTTYFPSGAVSTYRDVILRAEDPKVWGLQWVRCEHGSLFTEASNLPTNCISYVFTKDYSYISGRKRWMRIENYSDPIRDLAGAVITSRQDTVSIYDDSVCKVSET